MKSTWSENVVAAKPREYPYLGRWIGGDGHSIILFSGPRCGTVVYRDPIDTTNVLGEYYTAWTEYKFEVFYGKVELTN